MKYLLSLFILIAGMTVQAQYRQQQNQMDTIDISGSFRVGQGQTRTIDLGGKYFVQKLYIQAESNNSNDTYAEVIVNGETKGTLYLPGRDPHYVVTVAEVTETIQITSITNSARIHDIKAVVIKYRQGRRSHRGRSLPSQFYSEIGNLAYRVLQTVNELENYTNYRDYGSYLLPIRRVAARVIGVAEARGDASRYARPTYEALIDAMDHAQPYMDTMFEVDYALNLSIELASLNEQLKRALY